MRRLAIAGALLAVALCASAQTRFRRIHPLGEFSNLPVAEHAHGYSVQLWRVDSDLDGLLVVSGGPRGETPMAVLGGIRYNIRTGAISFNAKLVTGCTVLPGLKLKPASESFEFTGALNEAKLKGKMSRKDLDEPDRSPSIEELELAKRPDATLLEAGSFSEWKGQAAELARQHEVRCEGTLGEPRKKR
jgi:hypothetical protein